MLDTAEPHASIDPLMKRGMTFHESGQNLAAAKIFEVAYRRDPSAIAAILNMGSSYYKAQHYPEAEDAYKEALRLQPENATAHYGLAMVYEEIGDRPAARTQFQNAAELNPDAGKPWMSLAQVTLEETPRLQALHRAAEWAKRQLEIQDSTAPVLMEACAYLQEARLFVEAKAASERALQKDSTSHEAKSRMVGACLRLHDYAAAANAQRRIIMECKPKYKRPMHDDTFTKSAAKALIEVQKILGEAGVPFFLVAGTLLGCIRDKGPLPHDKDLDIGIIDEVSNRDVIETLRANSEFSCPLLYTEDDINLSVSHNGVTGIDIFRHERTGNSIWFGFDRHPGCMKWRFTPFGFKQQTFFNAPFIIPDKPERYLTETYGSWEKTDTGFSSVLSSPARYDVDNEYLRCMAYYRLWLAIHRCNREHLDKIFSQTPEYVRQDSVLYERLIFLTQCA